MSALEFEIVEWLGAAFVDELEASTLASLKIVAGPDRAPLTEVEDTIARTVRSHIRVPAYAMAQWLLVNWWRLRWEPRSSELHRDWIRAHSMAAIGGDYVWPALQFSSDGQFIQVQLFGEGAADVSAIRYLRNLNLEIPAAHFERAVERFLNLVEGRVSECLPHERALQELRVELKEERSDPILTKACKFQALAGKDPGTASPAWLSEAEAITEKIGPVAGEEVMAALPDLRHGLSDASRAIDSMRTSTTTVKIDLPAERASDLVELPWEKGARLASGLRAKLGITGVFSNDKLEELLNIKLPLSTNAKERALTGGFRNGVTKGRTAILVTSPRPANQRFMLGRLIGTALLSPPEEHMLPISTAGTALQKFQRSFAQELLCPWSELDAFTEEHGIDDDGIEDAANYFQVSELCVLSTLVNRNKIPRHRLMTGET